VNVAQSLIGNASLLRLATLPGCVWGCVTGHQAPEAPGTSLVAWERTTIEVDGGLVDVTSSLIELDFEGEADEYPLLSLRDGDVLAFEAEKAAGRAFLQHRGEVIREVRLLRETITRILDGEIEWAYETDFGIIFVLEHGAISVSKGSHHDEAIFVNIADSVEALEIPDRSIEWDWDNELGEEYRVERAWVIVGQIAEG